MATVTVEVNGRAYPVGCEDGQEAHVTTLAHQFDTQVREVAAQVGQVGELRLFLMAALLTADEQTDLKHRLDVAEARLAATDNGRGDAAAVRALEAAAARIEGLTETLR